MDLAEQLRDEIERSFADEPAHRAVEQHLADGHRALRRRRAAGAAAVCGVVAVLGTAYAVGSSGSDSDASRMIATSSPSPTSSPTSSPTPTSAPWEDDTPIRYVDGQLEIRDGAVVHQRIRNPYDYQPPKTSDALDLTYEGQRMWILADQQRNGFGYSSSEPSAGWASFRDWVTDQVSADGGDDLNGYPPTMRLAPDGSVVPVAGAQVFNRTDDPQLGASFAPAGATTGAAVVQPDGAPTAYFVVWRVIDGKLEVIYTRPGTVVGATFDELLSGARATYAGGEGLR